MSYIFFENLSSNTPINSDDILTTIFGDWRNVPTKK